MDYVATNGAPKAIGPYSQAVKANGLVYTSGQIPLDPATGDLVTGDFDKEVRRVFENLAAVLREAGSDFSRVLKATVYLSDLANFQAMTAIYAEYFGDHKPARTTIESKFHQSEMLVEIDCVAYKPR